VVSQPTAILMNEVRGRWRRMAQTCRKESASLRTVLPTTRVVRGQLGNRGAADAHSWAKRPGKPPLHRSWL